MTSEEMVERFRRFGNGLAKLAPELKDAETDAEKRAAVHHAYRELMKLKGGGR